MKTQGRSSRHEELLRAIAQEESRLEQIKAEQTDSLGRLGALQAELAALGAEPEIRVRLPLVFEAAAPRTSAEKVARFRSLFRGRDELFPTRFVSNKTGKAGYAPACRNKFVKGVCELPKMKCGECPNQAFIPFDGAATGTAQLEATACGSGTPDPWSHTTKSPVSVSIAVHRKLAGQAMPSSVPNRPR
jgi:hypothetical protein